MAQASETKKSYGLWETGKTVIYAVVIALVVRTFAYEPFNIPSGSMIPTLLVGDYLFVSKYSYGYSRYSFPFGLAPFSGRIFASAPKRGDVAVFRLPTDPSIDYIKRIIGLPGDKIQVLAGRLYINGKEVKRTPTGAAPGLDPYGRTILIRHYTETLPGGKTHPIHEMTDDGPLDNTGVYEVPPGHYFAMGDNRDNSSDSRVLNEVGFVPAENLVGRAEFIFFSTDGSARIWEVWNWFPAIWARRHRFFQTIE